MEPSLPPCAQTIKETVKTILDSRRLPGYEQRVSGGFSRLQHAGLISALGDALGRPVAPSQVDALGRYLELVATWNRKIDLTAARGPQALVEVLLADALVLADPTLVPQGSRLVDVGSGAGSPAVPLFLLRADLTGVLVEPLRKRVAFLRTALGSLALSPRVSVLESKLDPAEPSLPGAPFDVALSRATFAPELWAAAGPRLAARTLVLLAAQAPPAPSPGMRVAESVGYALPSTHASRTIVAYARDAQ